MPVLGAIIAFGFTELAGATVAAAVAELGLTGVAASAASGAIIGGVSGGLSAEITGGNVGKGIIGGLVSGGVGGGVSNLVSDALGGVSAVGDTGPQIPVKPTLGGSEALGAGAVKGNLTSAVLLRLVREPLKVLAGSPGQRLGPWQLDNHLAPLLGQGLSVAHLAA